MAIDPHEEYKLKQLIRELKGKVGRHTELVTVYVPAGYNLDGITSQLALEQGTAKNIKSSSTRKNVVDALERALQNLRIVGKTPPNGLALFSGNVSEKDGAQDLKVWSIEPPSPISIKLYRCDKNFILEPLEQMVAHKDVYGLITIDNKNATLATLKGELYTIVKTTGNQYGGKMRAGGQSAQRFERILKEQSQQFKKRVGEYATEIFMPIIKDLRGIVVGGPAGTKNEFLDSGYLHHELQKKIIAVKDTTYTDPSGIRELIDAAKDDLSDQELVRHKSIMQNFLQALVNDGAVCYGDDVVKAIAANAVDLLLLSETLDESVIDELYESTKAQGGTVEILSDESEEGFQLLHTFKGKAAMLRYKIE